MKNLLVSYTAILILFFLPSCSSSTKVDRPLDPWIMRINLDQRPNMIALALHETLYAAYDGKMGALYKVWKGGINFTGIVYDNIHGPQPLTQGQAYIEEDLKKSPWSLLVNGKKENGNVRYEGYKIENDKILLNYSIETPDNKKISITEKPDYYNKNGNPGFSREFEVSGVPDGTEILLNVGFDHLLSETDLQTNGTWEKSKFKEQTKDWGSSTSGNGRLKLNNTGSTYIKSLFQSKATAHVQIDNTENQSEEKPNKEESKSNEPVEDNMQVLASLGKDVLAKNDCAACHQVERQIIGPSYTMIAQKYPSTLETVNQLSQKIINGGSGVWGQQVMSAHPNISEEDAKAMSAYILSIVPDEENQAQPGVAVDFYQIGEPLSGLPEVLAGQNPNASEVYPSVDFRSGNPDIGEDTDENFSGFVKDFVMEVNGFLNVNETKTYQLQFIANNGGRLTINNDVVSEGQYYEGTYIEEIEVDLTAGANPFKINFYHHLFDKYLLLLWRENKNQEYEPIPASAFTHNPFDVKPTADGIKTLVSNKAPGFGASLEEVHPAFDLTAVRPEGFKPRVGDIEFRANGNLVLCTWDGEVFELTNPTSLDKKDITITKIADGLCEPLGITEVDGEIYVLQRWEVTRLVDHDGDNVTDEYVNIATFGSNAQFHEWSFGLIYKEGYFYCTTGIAMGWGAENMSIDRGKALKISMDGSYSYVAHGLKEPNGIGFGPDNEIFVTDNEGEWQPICKIFHIPAEGNPFYGNKSVEADNLSEDLKDVPPVIWLPQNEIGNSPSQPILMHHGPYEGQMIHGEITHGGIKRDFIEKIKGQYQGAVFRFTQGLEVGINRIEWGPDGALYASGLGGAQDFGHKGHQFGLQRLTYNKNVPFEMLAIRAKSNGLEVEFTKPLRVGDGTAPEDYKIQQWYYLWTEEGESQQKRELENLTIKTVSLSEDRTRAFLEIRGMKEEHVLYVQLQPTFLSTDNQQLWSNEGWYTLNRFPDEAGVVAPYKYQSKHNQLTQPEIDAGWVSMFNGSSSNHWNSNSTWSVKNGHLVSNGNEGIITSNKQYGNFELELEWKLDRDAEGGILYKIPERDNDEATGINSPRMQLIDDRTDEAKNIHTRKSGAVYDILQPKYVVTKPDEYNKARIVVHDDNVEHWINGIKVVEYNLTTVEWKEKLSISSFRSNIDFGKAATGNIGLYAERGKLWIRNVRLREL